MRVIWQSPRFSEDLDFTGFSLKIKDIEEIMQDALSKIEQSGIETGIAESKGTSGGYLAIFAFRTGDYKSRIRIEVSLRKERAIKGAAALVQSDFVPVYTLMHLDEALLVGEKVQACLTRGKPRDFYDLYFILRGRMAFQEIFVKDKTLKTKLLSAINKRSRDFSRELKQFLPVNQHLIIKGFPEALVREIEKNLAGRQ